MTRRMLFSLCGCQPLRRMPQPSSSCLRHFKAKETICPNAQTVAFLPHLTTKPVRKWERNGREWSVIQGLAISR
jgi:hypothetical protein